MITPFASVKEINSDNLNEKLYEWYGTISIIKIINIRAQAEILHLA